MTWEAAISSELLDPVFSKMQHNYFYFRPDSALYLNVAVFGIVLAVRETTRWRGLFGILVKKNGIDSYSRTVRPYCFAQANSRNLHLPIK